MKKITILALMIISLVILSCQKNTKEDKKDVPLFKIKGDVMETYYPDGTLQGRGGFKADTLDSKPVNLKNGEWTFFQQGSKGKVVAAKGGFADDKRDGLWVINYPSGKVKSEMTYSGGKLNGVTKNYAENGNLTAEIPYVNDKVTGKKITYGKDNLKLKEEMFRDGKKNGQSTTYFQNGKVQISAVYSDDKLNGNWCEYYDSGKKKMEGRQIPVTEEKIKEDARWAEKEGLKTGAWTLYHSNGNKFMTGNYSDNKMTGKWLVYAPEGYLDSEGMYVDNCRDGIWRFYDKSHRLVKELNFAKDMVDGKCRVYNNGKLTGEGNMTGLPKNPKRNGEWKEIYPNGKAVSVGPYRMDKKIGKFREYYQTGALKGEGEYMNDKRNGDWIFYKADGKTVDAELSGYYMMDRLNKKLEMR